MKPNTPLSWIGTTTRARDQGLFHLEASYSFLGPLVVFAACGTRPFAYTGSFPDGHPTVPLSARCQKCEAMAEKVRPMACPECGYLELKEALSQMVTHDIPCPRCGRFKLSEFLPVAR
jgi:ribosomal protein S27AE